MANCIRCEKLGRTRFADSTFDGKPYCSECKNVEEEIERKMRATERLNQTIERNSSVVNDIYETKRRTKKKDDYER